MSSHSLGASFSVGLCVCVCLLTTLAIPTLCSTPGVNIFTLFCVCISMHLPFGLYWIWSLKWRSMAQIISLLSAIDFLSAWYQSSFPRVMLAGWKWEGWGGREMRGSWRKLDRSLAIYLKASQTECTWRREKMPENCNLEWKIIETEGFYQSQDWASFFLFPLGLLTWWFSSLHLFWMPSVFLVYTLWLPFLTVEVIKSSMCKHSLPSSEGRLFYIFICLPIKVAFLVHHSLLTL